MRTHSSRAFFCTETAFEGASLLLQDPRAKLSRDLVALLADDYKPALDLLRRVYPPGLVQYLNQQLPRPPAPAQRQPTLQAERPPAQVSTPWLISCCRRGLLHGNNNPLSYRVRSFPTQVYELYWTVPDEQR